jgi:hypothetical protein
LIGAVFEDEAAGEVLSGGMESGTEHGHDDRGKQ